MSTAKKMHNLKFENDVSLRGHTEDISPGDKLSDNFERLFQRSKGEKPGYLGVLQQKTR